MNKNTAEVCGNCLIIGERHLKIEAGGHSDELLKQIAKRWNAYMDMIRFLERVEYVFNCAILRTPTGEVREECTGLNIERMQFLTEAKVDTKTRKEEHEGPG